MSEQPILYTGDDEVELPWKWEICGTCRGNGHHNPHAYTADEFAEAFPFPEDVEDYLAGHYDRRCDDCEGDGKVKVADFSRMTSEQAKAYREQLEDDAEYRAAVEAERRFGC
jgi:hypothetical protein